MSKAVDSWLSPPLKLKLSSQEVHIWRVYIDTDDSIIKKLQALLSADERSLAARFRFEKDSAKYIVARGTLRIILSRYLDKKPEELKFSYNQYGKPTLHYSHTNQSISFNLSHSHGLALIAVTQNRDIGVDIEYVHSDFDYEEIAERFFSPTEKAVWRLLPTSVK
ncbi:4'-phosphopantetheinyl transferase [Calothrix sp. NIES-4071]|nr:4'-phosphopantetheinyl transferase [Calothrix sp. NIES-4071]BAZ57638.1 4'-phosphopantetheinyl transferase [Calothrix sp. NIES-4105]